ncbi:MAG: hypothetical protein KF746_04000 [Chitinophagaceae bacterium]|nr:hypothetical protein [Chitinophagaceae bacterium]
MLRIRGIFFGTEGCEPSAISFQQSVDNDKWRMKRYTINYKLQTPNPKPLFSVSSFLSIFSESCPFMKVTPYTLFSSILKFCLLGLLFTACKKGVQEQTDELYSRHLQRHVKLTIIHTPIPGDKADVNLLVLNDGEQSANLRLTTVIDSLYKAGQIQPLAVVAIHAGNRKEEFGIADTKGNNGRGGKADHYDSFFNNELYPFAKKKAGVRKFKSVTVAGFGAGALSALDIAWNHPDKISKAGIFSGAFNRTADGDRTQSDTACYGMMYEKVKSSRKRPVLQFWIYAGQNGTTALPNDDADHILNSTTCFVELLSAKKFITEGDIVYEKGIANNAAAWQQRLPDFLKWAVGK